MTADYVQPVAKAYGEASPELHSIAKKQQDEIKAEIARLQTQAYAIRQLVNLAPAPPSPPVEVQAEDVAQVANAATVEVITAHSGQQPPRSLTEEQKKLDRELWESERRAGRDLSSQEVVDLMRGHGVAFGVQMPAAAIGMTLSSVRRAWKLDHPDEMG
jgi:hypothetical protein